MEGGFLKNHDFRKKSTHCSMMFWQMVTNSKWTLSRYYPRRIYLKSSLENRKVGNRGAYSIPAASTILKLGSL
jgi:phosphorylcholine metabolism protein LicD